MSATKERSLEKLLTLLTHAQRGAFAIALYDRLSVRREMTAALRSHLSQTVYEVHLSEHENNPVELIRALEPGKGDVVMLFDMERAFPDALGYLDFHRESLTEMGISLVCWVNRFEHRELAQKAPNFYAFRTTVFDFTSADELRVREGRKKILVLDDEAAYGYAHPNVVREGRKKILVLDDERVWLDFMKFILADEYDLTLATSPQAAIKALKSDWYSLAIIDIRLGNQSGLEALKQMQAIQNNLPALIMTGYPDVLSVLEGESIGACDYMSKASNNLPSELKAKVREVLK